MERIFETGMFGHRGHRYSMNYELKDVDFASLSDEGKYDIYKTWGEVLHSLDGGGNLFKISIINRHKNKKKELSKSMLSELGDGYDNLRLAINRLRYDDVAGDNSFIQDKFVTITSTQKNEEKAQSYFKRLEKDLNKKLSFFDSSLQVSGIHKRMEVLYNFFRPGKEAEFNFVFDEKESKGKFKDYICPDAIKFNYDHFVMGDKVGRVMMIKTLGNNIKDDFLTRLAEIKTNLVLTADILPTTMSEAQKIIDMKDSDVETNADAWSNKSRIREGSAIRLPRRISRDRKIIDSYIDDLDNNNQMMFFVQILIVYLADDKVLLDEYTESIMETASESTSQMSILYFQQEKALQDALPFGVRTITNLRDCNTDTTAMLLPFNAVTIDHSTGIPYGRHEETGQQQIVDRRLLTNGHEWILGVSGSGKSTNAKIKMSYEVLCTDGDFIIIDPDGEFTPWVHAFGGQVIRVGIDSLNIADISLAYGQDLEPTLSVDPVKKKIDLIITFLENVLDKNTRFGDIEKSIIDKACRTLYGAVMEGKTEYITLMDIYDLISGYELPEAVKLAVAMERHVKGSFNCFAQATSVSYNSRIVCYNLLGLQEQEKAAGMLVVMDQIDLKLSENREKDRITFIKIDEVSYFFKNKKALELLQKFSLRSRKYGGLITYILQNVSFALQIPEVKRMLDNAETVVMLKQASEDAVILAEMYGLSSNQIRSLVRAENGHGINKIGDIIYGFDGTIPKDNEIYRLVNTDVGKS